MAERIPPQNLDAEKSVLGAILLDKNAVIEVAQFLKPEFFYSPIHGFIFESVLDLFSKGEPIDILTISNNLKKKKRLEKIGGAVYLTELAESVPTSSNAEYYGLIVKQAYVRRSLISVSGEINELGFNENLEIEEIIDEAEKRLFQVANDGKTADFVHIKDLLKEAYERAEELEKKKDQWRGIPTGFLEIDKILGGLQESNLIIIAARPSVGKSSFALDIARHATLKENKAVGIFSLEMSNLELTDRLIASQVGMNLWDYRMGHIKEEQMEILGDVMGQLSEIDLYLDDTPGQTIMEIRTKARRLSMEKKLDLIIVDYLQLIASGRNIDNRVQEVGEISKALKNLARELRIPVVALSQLSRAVETRTSKTPQLSDLRESGCLRGDTIIQDIKTKQNYSIASLVGKAEPITVYAMNEQKQIVPAEMEKVFSSGIKDIYRLTTVKGRVIDASANHPFFKKIHGWTKLEKLEKGDKIAVLCNKGEGVYQAKVTRFKQSGESDNSIAYNTTIQNEMWEVGWDEIVSIEYVSTEEVFDATVPAHHNFVANTIIVHNSIEQDADVVLFLSRPEKDDPEAAGKTVETADITVAKHRNGPTGSAKLAFVRAQAKFADIAS